MSRLRVKKCAAVLIVVRFETARFEYVFLRSYLLLKIISAILLIVWLVQIARGKGGFSHLLLVVGLSILVVDLTAAYRRRMTE